MRAVKK